MTTILPDFVVINPMFSITSLLYDTLEYSFGIRLPFNSFILLLLLDKFVVIYTNLSNKQDKIRNVIQTEDRKVYIYSDTEGGNIRFLSPNGRHWEIDAHDNTNARLYTDNGKVIFVFGGNGDMIIPILGNSGVGTIIRNIQNTLSNLSVKQTIYGTPASGIIDTTKEVVCRCNKIGNVCHVSLSFSPLHTWNPEWVIFSGIPAAYGVQDFQYTLYREDYETVHGSMRIEGTTIKAWYGNQPKVGDHIRCGFTYVCN